ncbi:transmembrane protein 151B-like [Salvelinus sp. IW2-2015]|uniref:transmembrane protein 151B-like n=1 Tax=Salvelinus sp. IW2-2015 TaxID=2691554 RepID=UPI0038D4DDBA
MEAREGMHLKNVDFREHMLAFPDPAWPPWFSRRRMYWLISALMLSWPLRVVSEYRTAYVHYHVEKLFGENEEVNDNDSTEMGNYRSGQENGQRGGPRLRVISRVNTVDITELEWHIRCNQQMVPSYSEALLMDLNTNNTTSSPSAFTGATRVPMRRNSSYVLQSCPRCRRSTSSSSLPSRVRGNVAMGAGSLTYGTVGRMGGGRLALSRSGFSLGRLHTVRQACLFHSRSLGAGMGSRGDEGGGFLGLGLRRANEESRGVLEGEGFEEDENSLQLEEDREQELERVRTEIMQGVACVTERPPAYQEALHLPVLIVHGEESCHGGEDLDAG